MVAASEASQSAHESVVRCPYCTEEIRAAAIACKHCSRDLSFVLPLLRQMKELRREVHELGARIDEIGVIEPYVRPESAGEPSPPPHGIVLAMAAAVGLVVGLANWLWWQAPGGSTVEAVLGFLHIGTAPAAAFGLAFAVHGTRWFHLVEIGALASAGYVISEGVEVGVSVEEAFGIAAILTVMSISSGVFGRWVGDKLVRKERFSSMAAHIRRTIHPASAITDRRAGPATAGFATAMTALAPIVTALVPLALALLSFLSDQAQTK